MAFRVSDLQYGVPLDGNTRERVIFLAGKVAGVDCNDCSFQSRDVSLDAHTMDPVSCPDCGATILTAEQKSQLRQAGKL